MAFRLRNDEYFHGSVHESGGGRELVVVSRGARAATVGLTCKEAARRNADWVIELRRKCDDGTNYRLGVGSTIGGATFIARDNLGGSPSLIVAGERGVSVVKWPYQVLHDTIVSRPRMGAPLYEGITRAMIVKYRMLREHESAPLSSYSSVHGVLMPNG